MSKFGYSYPPGVTENMLPGNSKEEREAEAMVDSLYTTVAPLRPSVPTPCYEEVEDEVVTALEKMLGEAYAKGKADAMADNALASEASGADAARERSEQRRPIPQSVCVACGMTEFDCTCEVRDFENK